MYSMSCGVAVSMPHGRADQFQSIGRTKPACFDYRPNLRTLVRGPLVSSGDRELSVNHPVATPVNLLLYDPLKQAIRYTRASARLPLSPRFKGDRRRLYGFLAVSCPSILHGLGYVVV